MKEIMDDVSKKFDDWAINAIEESMIFVKELKEKLEANQENKTKGITQNAERSMASPMILTPKTTDVLSLRPSIFCGIQNSSNNAKNKYRCPNEITSAP